MNKKAFTAVELMITLILLALVLTYLWHVFSASRKNATEIIENHMVNDELDRELIKITDDIREANLILEGKPPIYDFSQISSLETGKEENVLEFIKVTYDFSVDPTELDGNKVNYTKKLIKYYVEKEDESNPNSKWVLIREMTPIDTDSSVVEPERNIYTVKIPPLEECIFYRVNDPDTTRTGNLFIKMKLGRQDKSQYTSESTICVKERGTMPKEAKPE